MRQYVRKTGRMLPVLSACGLLGLAAAAGPAAGSRDVVEKTLLWSLVPGGGHFYLGETRTGAAYAGSMLSLGGAAVWLDQENDEEERDDEVNTFLLLAIKEWELSLFTAYRSALRVEGSDLRRMYVDDTPVPELFLAPFRRRYALDPMVIGAGLLGVASAAFESRDADKDAGYVTRVGVLGADANQEWGTALYGADAFALSLAAGVSEEAIWRGVIQSEAELAWGPRAALWTTASLFGAAHVVDLDGELSGERVLAATIAGFYLGGLYQARDHRLGPPIAAHFWFNLTAMLTSFALDPENNPLGVEVSLGF